MTKDGEAMSILTHSITHSFKQTLSHHLYYNYIYIYIYIYIIELLVDTPSLSLCCAPALLVVYFLPFSTEILLFLLNSSSLF